MLCLKLTLLPLIPLVQMTSESASAKGWGQRGKAGGRRERSGNMSHRLSFISRVRSKIIWILPIKTHKRSHNALNSEYHYHHYWTWLCNVLPVCFIDIGGEQFFFVLPWGTFTKQIMFSFGMTDLVLLSRRMCVFVSVLVLLFFLLLYYVSLDGMAMLIFHSTWSLQGKAGCFVLEEEE